MSDDKQREIGEGFLDLGIAHLIEDSHATSRDKGWWRGLVPVEQGIPNFDYIETHLYPTEIDDKHVIVEMVMTKLMLACGELHEAGEELRAGHSPNEIYWRDKKTRDVVKDTGQTEAQMLAGGYSPEGFPIEVADTFIRLGDLCGLLGIDLAKALKIKAAYNTKRPYRHGGKAV